MRLSAILSVIIAPAIALSHAEAQTANTVYTGITVYTVMCNNGTNPFVQYLPTKIEISKTGITTLELLQQSASSPGNAPVSLDGSGYLAYVIQPPNAQGTRNYFLYSFTLGSQRSAFAGSGATLTLTPGKDPVSGVANLGFQFATSGSGCTFTFDGGSVELQAGL